MSRRRNNERQRGFSYIGLLILIMILGVTTAATLTAGAAMQRRVAEEELLFIGEQFQMALKSYADSTPAGGRSYPRQLVDLAKDPRFPTTKRHLRKIYIDPLTGSNDWGIVTAPEGGISGIYSRSQETPIRTSGFPPTLSVSEGAKSYAEWVFFAPILNAPQPSSTSP